MGKSILDGNDLVLTKIPVYASNIVEGKSNGLAGEIIVSKNNLNFFEVTENERVINNKKCLELNSNNRYTFDKDNILSYMQKVKGEYISTALFTYKQFRAEPWKNVDIIGWQRRVKIISSSNFSCKFNIYIKKTQDKDTAKEPRYYIGGLNSNEYSIIIKYCIIPGCTNIRVQKQRNSHGGYDFTFLLEALEVEDIRNVLEMQHVEKELSLSRRTKKDLYKIAKEKSDLEQETWSEKNVVTKVYKRDPAVSAYVKMRADGRCDMCGKDAPFADKKGVPYLEEHHVIRLADGGEDSIDNAVALCPNCHRKVHIVGTEETNKRLLERLFAYATVEASFLDGKE